VLNLCVVAIARVYLPQGKFGDVFRGSMSGGRKGKLESDRLRVSATNKSKPNISFEASTLNSEASKYLHTFKLFVLITRRVFVCLELWFVRADACLSWSFDVVARIAQDEEESTQVEAPEEPNLAAKHFLGDEVLDLPKIGSKCHLVYHAVLVLTLLDHQQCRACLVLCVHDSVLDRFFRGIAYLDSIIHDD
jgi:hypothetical protein